MSGPALFGHDLFGEVVKPRASGPVAERFIIPPFTVLDAKQGDWQERKRAWLAMGIKSEESREAVQCYRVSADATDFVGSAMLDRGGAVSVFDPVLCELAYRWFSPAGGQVLDPFAGGSVRGIVAAALGRRYYGIDLRAEQIDANLRQAADLLPNHGYGPDDITPVQQVGDLYLKRDDLCSINGASGGKARTCWALAKTASKGLTTAGSRHSPQVLLVASMAKALGLPAVCHVPHGWIEADSPVAHAQRLGAEIVQHAPGYNTVIVARAREYADQHGYTLIPFGMECAEAIEQTRRQVANLPAGVQRIVVPVGSGMSLAGILHGLDDIGRRDIPVLAIRVGADPASRLDAYAPGWQDRVSLVTAEEQYDQAVQVQIGGVDLDPVYEAKCARYLQPGDLLWIVGHRDPTACAGPVPQWIAGDSAELLAAAPKCDLLFSCPPYGNLEVYSDDPADLSAMPDDQFLEAYRLIIARGVERMLDNSFACFVVGDFRDKRGLYRNFVSNTIQAFEDAGARLYNEAILATPIGSAGMRVTKQFNSGRKMAKTHQNVLVFVKGDPKKAAAKCIAGDPDAGDQDGE